MKAPGMIPKNALLAVVVTVLLTGCVSETHQAWSPYL